jgi:hypothetical protein
MKNQSPENQLAKFIDRFSPAIAALAREARTKLQTLLPGAVEMVYDNYNALVIGFGPTEKASEAILSLALYPRWVNLFFLHGARLPDPQRRLKGKGKQVRSITLEDAETLDEPAVQNLIAAAVARAEPLDSSQPGRLIIKSIAANQRPRRPTK